MPLAKLEEYARIVFDLITEPELQEYKNSYFSTWIGRSFGWSLVVVVIGSPNLGNRRLGKEPRFPHKWWNLFDRIKAGDSTTDNYAEGNNNCLVKLMGVKRPGVWRFILRLQSTYTYYQRKYEEFLGPSTPRKKTTYEEKRAKAVKETVDRFNTLTAKEYLWAIVMATSV